MLSLDVLPEGNVCHEISFLSCCFQVVFIKKLDAFQSLPNRQFPCENKHDIYFADEMIFAKYRYGMVSDFVASLQTGDTRNDHVWYVCYYQGHVERILVNIGEPQFRRQI